MATEQYTQEITPPNNFIKEKKTSSENWNSSAEAIDDSDNISSGGFDCNICLDSVQDPVVTLCGHLYCWPCIYKWIHHQNSSSETLNSNHNAQCPVCKQDISQKTLVPLYGRGQTKPKSDVDLDMVIPRRPSSPSCGARTLPAQQDNPRGNQQITSGSVNIQNLIINPMSPTTGMLGEMVYGGIFGNTETSLYTYPNSYNLVPISTQRARRQAMRVDKSLGRIFFFLFCCMMLCLIVF